MTIVGQAEISITAGTAQFPAQLAGGVNPALAATDAKMRASATSAKKAWSSAASGIAGAFEEQLGPVQGTLSHIGSALKEHGKVAGTLIGGGAGLMGAGIAGAALGSSEQAAMQSLQQSVLNTGHSWTEYSDRAEEAIHKGESMAFSSKDTLNALSTMTVALHSPEKALGSLTFAMNIARKNHIGLAEASSLAARASLGMARGLLPLGVNISADTKLVTAATSAQKAHASAVDSLKAKQRALSQEEQRVGASATTTAADRARAAASIASAEAAVSAARFSHGAQSPQYAAAEARLAAARAATNTATGPTVSEEIALSNARKAVADAQSKVAATTKTMKAANDDAAGAQHRLDTAVSRAKDNVHGLDSAYVDTFSGHFDVWKTKIEDQAAMLGHQYGPALIGVGIGLQGLGAAYTTAGAIMGRFRGAQDATKIAAGEATIAIEAETTALSEEGLAGAISGAESEVGALERTTSTAGRGFSGLAGTGSSAMGKLGGAVAGVTGLIGSYEVGAHTGSLAAGTLGGALTGAVAGFMALGPEGAVVGALGGAGAGTIGHFLNETSGKLYDVDAQVHRLAHDLVNELGSNSKYFGANEKSWINQQLGQRGNLAPTLDKYGIKMPQIMDLLMHGKVGQAFTGPGWEKFNRAADGRWKTMPDGSRQLVGQSQAAISASQALTLLMEAFQKAFPEAQSISHINRHHRGHRAGGGDVAAGASYVVGEHGPEVLQMGATDGHVYSHNGIGPRGSGAELVDQVRAQRIDTLRLINGLDRLIRATEDTPHGITAELTRGGHQLRSPELASL